MTQFAPPETSENDVQRVDFVEIEQCFDDYLDRTIAGESFIITRDGFDYVIMQPYRDDAMTKARDHVSPG